MTKTIDLRAYLDRYATFARSQFPETDATFVTGEELVAALGRPYTIQPGLPAGASSGEMRLCFQNALFATREVVGPGFAYCEGWAVGKAGIPCMHAWLVDCDGNAFDPTWTEGTVYFGVAFDLEWVIDRVLQAEVYGILAGPGCADLYVDGVPDDALWTP